VLRRGAHDGRASCPDSSLFFFSDFDDRMLDTSLGDMRRALKIGGN
jgi:hypothetical protein